MGSVMIFSRYASAVVSFFMLSSGVSKHTKYGISAYLFLFLIQSILYMH